MKRKCNVSKSKPFFNQGGGQRFMAVLSHLSLSQSTHPLSPCLSLNMAPVLLETRSAFLNSNNNNSNLWQGLWSDIINAIRPTTPSTRPRRNPTTTNKIEPLDSVTFTHHHSTTQQQQQLFMDSKFQLEYVSFPRLAEEEKDHSDDNDEEDDQAEKTTTLDKAKMQSRKSCSSVGGSRRRLLGSPWMF